MPHERIRYLEPLLRHALKHSPIVGILGQRQSGKTTLIRKVTLEYETLDRRSSLELAQENPESFVTGRALPFGIDECQLAPSLFPALKEAVRVHPRKGQFILTGSVRFTSRKAIRESLTGRIFNLELLPMSIAENFDEPLPSALLGYQKNSAKKAFSSESDGTLLRRFESFLETGGLPGICFHREPTIRTTYFGSHLETLLDRDLRLLQNTTLPFSSLRGVLSLLAQNQGQPIDYTELSRNTQVSVVTLKKLLSSFEGMFLIRRILSTGGAKAPVFFLEDQGLATHLLKTVGVTRNPLLDLQRGLFGNLLPQFHYRPGLAAQVFQYRTRGGALAPLAIKSAHGHLGVIPCLGDSPAPAAIGSARSFLKAHSKSKVVIACQGGKMRVWDEQLVSLPLSSLLR